MWRDETILPLRPKLYAMLWHLVRHAGRLVTRDELLAAVWPGTTISEGVLRGCVRDLREALQDDALAPRVIETVPRRGYRFIAPLVRDTAPYAPGRGAVQPAGRPRVIGREAELARLAALLARARGGARQAAFVIGEPGIGKTTLVAAFLASLDGAGDPWIGQGQCVEQYGAGEPYLPLLEALGRAARAPQGDRLLGVLRRFAPSWLAQMPGLAGDGNAPRRLVEATTPERMLRELIEAVEVLTAEREMILVLEDLHWADHSTLDWLAAVGKQRAPARLLVIGTYRPAEVSLHDHRLRAVKQELLPHGHCEDLWLPFLAPDHVAGYLTARFGEHALPDDLAVAIHRRTDGNPLFIVNVLDDLCAQGVLAESDGRWRLRGRLAAVERSVPPGLRQLVERQIERLTGDDRAVLEVASVAGAVFAAATVAGALEAGVEAIEERCQALARRGHFLRCHDPERLGDGSTSGRYGFQHRLYEEVLYERLAPTRRARLHRHIGALQAARWGPRAAEIAAELAMHFERGNEPDQATAHHEHAAEAAVRSHAYHEAAAHLSAAVSLLERLPNTVDRAGRELRLQVRLGAMRILTKGYAAAEVERCYTRARTLCAQLEDTHAVRLPSLLGLWLFHVVRSEHDTAQALARELVAVAEAGGDRTALAYAQMALGTSAFWTGELDVARSALERAADLGSLDRPAPASRAPDSAHVGSEPPEEAADPYTDSFLQTTHPGVAALAYGAVTLSLLGHPADAFDRAMAAQHLAGTLPHPHNLGIAQCFSAWAHQACGDEAAVAHSAGAMMQLCAQHGFPIWAAIATALDGWVRARQGDGAGGIAAIEKGIADHHATGAVVGQPYLRQLLVEAYEATGDLRRGIAAANDALTIVARTGERVCAPALERLKRALADRLGRRPTADERRASGASRQRARRSAVRRRR